MPSRRLKVVVVGAGIGGMAAAVGLGLAGHEVIVLEGAPAIGEVGAGLQVAPNMMRILERWGLAPTITADSVSLVSVDIRRWEDGRLLGTAPVNRSFGEQYVIHRADLHRALYDKAAALPGVDVRVNATVVSADFDAPSVTLTDGSVVTADVVFAADGVKSRLRAQLLALDSDEPTPTGDAAYRLLLSRAQLLADPDLKPLIDSPTGTRWIGPGRHVMAYPIKRHSMYNMVLLHPDTGSEESWTATSSRKEMLDMYRGWDPRLLKLLRLCADEKVPEWKLCTHSFLKTWVRGKVALMGDACHPMLPYVAQGAAQAVEDAATLAVLLSDCADIPTALKLYESARKERCERIQGTAAGNRIALHMPDGPEQKKRDGLFAKVCSGGENPDKWGDPSAQEFLWGWDAEEVAKAAVRKESKL